MAKIVPFIIILIVSLSFTVNAQFLEIGGYGGGLSFNGDVNEGGMLANSSAGFGAFIRYNPHPRFGLSLGFIKGSLEAKDRTSQLPHIRERNLSFRSDLTEFSLISELNILSFYPQKDVYAFAPYLGAGIAVILFNPTAKYNGEWVELQKVGTEGQGLEGYPKKYNLVQVAIPILFGLKYSIGGRLNIAVEVGYRFTFTDYLDDVSTVFVSPKELINSSELAVALSNRTEEYTGAPANHLIGTRRGNANNNDGYLTMGVRISFSLYAKKAYPQKKIEYKINKWF
ncbi:type IX secretion system protein PorG [Aureispira anguillae]|uniref:DUF6089 family protein n=1 Tax=Aureispira anguillae TaxID=2864201 RepID=A0A916DRJ8_9BACT|nr:DUF6089 family protein [Aureispira anguillae]BDS10256.1 DUF6089 family protein [Aureispira anguillae]